MKYDALSSSDSWLSSSAVLEAMTARPFCVSPDTELYEKSAAGSAPFTRENDPLWQASRTTMVIVDGTARSRSRRVASGSSSAPRLTALARA